MALLFVEGFERYGSAPGAPTGLATKYSQVGGSTNTTLIAGRISGLGLKVNQAPSGSPHIVPAAFGNVSTWIIGFGFRTGAELISTRIFSLYDSSTEQFALRQTVGGELAVYKGTTLLATSAVVLSTDSWYYIELKVVLHGSTGSYELRLNGVNILSDGSEDTTGTSNNYAQTIRFWGAFNSDPDTQFGFDDIYICDGTGATENDFLTPRQVFTSFVNAAGDSTQFTPSAGSNYQCVDDVPHDSDATYVESGTSGHQDLYGVDNVALTDITAVQISVVCKQTDDTPFDIKLVAKSDSTVDEGSAIAVGATDYVTRSRILVENPHTTAPWTDSDIDSAQFGIEVG
jgi:hypothetical protein